MKDILTISNKFEAREGLVITRYRCNACGKTWPITDKEKYPAQILREFHTHAIEDHPYNPNSRISYIYSKGTSVPEPAKNFQSSWHSTTEF